MLVLKAVGIDKAFEGLKAITNLSFSIFEGEIVGIIGPNGAGKSTLFNILTGFTEPDRGEIEFLGRDIVQLPTHKIVELGIGRTFQTPRVTKSSTVLDNIIVGFHSRTRSGLFSALLKTKRSVVEMSQTVEESLSILESLQLRNKAWDLASNLTVGEQRRMEIACALATGPKLLLLDEPMAGMSAEEIEHTVAAIRRIRLSGVTILLIEHNMRVLMELSDRVVAMNFGRKIAEGTPREVQNNPDVLDVYLGSTKIGTDE
ncbi:MAG: ABC transporter ATP-binding protein [Desulfobacteraceae bacterium]|nr:MAG: ABC transporter ATP-binding protein [Desulfobacteraceae bacterium]